MADNLSKFNIKGTLANVIDREARSEIASQSESMSEIQSEIDSQSVAYSEMFSEVDEDIEGKQTAISYSGGFTGNIDDVHNISIAFCIASSASGTLPYTTGYFLLETFKADNGTTFIQKAYKYGSTDGITSISYRMFSNNQWYPWKSVALS